jgi:hypothetical protein
VVAPLLEAPATVQAEFMQGLMSLPDSALDFK